MILVPAHVGELERHFGETLVPKGHRVHDAVGFRRRGDVLLLPRHRKFECVGEHPVDALARKNAFLDDQFLIGSRVEQPHLARRFGERVHTGKG